MSIRHRLVALVVAAIVGVLAGTAATPAAICGLTAARLAEAEIVCTCGHGAGAQCPMHPHHQSADASTSKSTKTQTPNRWCAGCRDSVDATLTAMFGFAAPIVDRQQLFTPDGRSEWLLTFQQLPLDGIHPPISPPPRG
jgi:hypothetical protein